MEPENNIEVRLDGFHATKSESMFVVVGNYNNAYGKKMVKKFSTDGRILFTGAVFNADETNSLRAFCKIYFHGHSVGGTNPSLLQAMASKALIAAHDNDFNRAVLKNDACYFKSTEDVTSILEKNICEEERGQMIQNNITRIEKQYNWPDIINQYDAYIKKCYNQMKK